MTVSQSSVTDVAAPIASAYIELRESDPASTAWGSDLATLLGSHGSRSLSGAGILVLLRPESA